MLHFQIEMSIQFNLHLVFDDRKYISCQYTNAHYFKNRNHRNVRLT